MTQNPNFMLVCPCERERRNRCRDWQRSCVHCPARGRSDTALLSSVYSVVSPLLLPPGKGTEQVKQVKGRRCCCATTPAAARTHRAPRKLSYTSREQKDGDRMPPPLPQRLLSGLRNNTGALDPSRKRGGGGANQQRRYYWQIRFLA